MRLASWRLESGSSLRSLFRMNLGFDTQLFLLQPAFFDSLHYMLPVSAKQNFIYVLWNHSDTYSREQR